jgi:TolB-like protein/tetratricopeptide (TPR) repeat protein
MSIFTELKRRNVLRVAAAYLVVGWLLTEVLTTILPTLGAPEWAAKAVILSFAFGFIPAVVLSWIYEITPDGVRKEAQTEAGETAVPLGKLDFLTIAGVVSLIVFAAVFSAIQAPGTLAADRAVVSNESVAVLPFVNMSRDEDNEYLSDGLTETLLHMLAQVPDLKVAARTSSFAFKGKNMDVREIAAALQVAHILEGSVQQIGKRIRITAQLIRASDGYHVWSEIFDRESDDIFAIQDEIATKVGASLSASLLGSTSNGVLAGVGTEDADAYDLYLQALKERTTFSYGGLKAAEELLKGALLIDPDFVDAKKELASNYLHQLETGLMTESDALPSVLAMTDQVLQSNPNDVGARALQVVARTGQQLSAGKSASIGDMISELEGLVEANPDDYAIRLLLSKMLQGVHRFDDALQLQKASLQADPYNARIHYEIGALSLELDRLDEARSALETSLEIEPRQPNAYLKLGLIALKTGDGVDYVRRGLKAMEIDSRDHEIPAFIGLFLYQLGLVEEADDFRDRVLTIAPTSEAAYRLELARAVSLNDSEAAVAAARRAIEDRVGNRQFAFGGAVEYLLRTAAENGSIDAEIEYLQSHWPGLLDVDAPAVPVKHLTAQLVAFDAWYQTLPRSELLRRVDKVEETIAGFGGGIKLDAIGRLTAMALRGETEAALELALSEVFNRPVIMDLEWQKRYSQPQFAALMADSRIQAAARKWEAEEVAVREAVAGFLADISAVA